MLDILSILTQITYIFFSVLISILYPVIYIIKKIQSNKKNIVNNFQGGKLYNNIMIINLRNSNDKKYFLKKTFSFINYILTNINYFSEYILYFKCLIIFLLLGFINVNLISLDLNYMIRFLNIDCINTLFNDYNKMVLLQIIKLVVFCNLNIIIIFKVLCFNNKLIYISNTDLLGLKNINYYNLHNLFITKTFKSKKTKYLLGFNYFRVEKEYNNKFNFFKEININIIVDCTQINNIESYLEVLKLFHKSIKITLLNNNFSYKNNSIYVQEYITNKLDIKDVYLNKNNRYKKFLLNLYNKYYDINFIEEIENDFQFKFVNYNERFIRNYDLKELWIYSNLIYKELNDIDKKLLIINYKKIILNFENKYHIKLTDFEKKYIFNFFDNINNNFQILLKK